MIDATVTTADAYGIAVAILVALAVAFRGGQLRARPIPLTAGNLRNRIPQQAHPMKLRIAATAPAEKYAIAAWQSEDGTCT